MCYYSTYKIMPKRRIFIAVNLPADVKNGLKKARENWRDLPAKWTKADNLHITLIFIGYATDEEVLEIAKIAREIAQKRPPFSVSLSRIELGPPGGPPKMIWAEAEPSEELAELKRELEDAFFHSQKSGYLRKENREFRPHITLGRILQREWRESGAQKQFAGEKINLTFYVSSVELMESKLKRGAPEYAILESVELGAERDES